MKEAVEGLTIIMYVAAIATALYIVFKIRRDNA